MFKKKIGFFGRLLRELFVHLGYRQFGWNNQRQCMSKQLRSEWASNKNSLQMILQAVSGFI
jgi:hypothetical protein